MFVWAFGISAWMLIRYGYGIHDWLWWLVCAVVGAAISLMIGWISVVASRQVIAARRAAVAELDRVQLKLVARAWKRGPVPDDPAVLIAALRLNDLSAQYCRRTRRLRLVVVVFVGVWAVASVLFNFNRHSPHATALIFVVWVVYLIAWLRPEIRGWLRRRRVVELRAAADQDPHVSAAIADPVTPAPRPGWRWWMVALVVVVALAYGGLFGAAYYFSPKVRGCQAARSVVHEIYANRDWFWTTNIGPTGRPLGDYQHLAGHLREKATAAEVFLAVAPHARRIAELADHAATVVAAARQPTGDASADMLRHRQTDFAHILDAIAIEEDPLVQVCLA